MAKDPYHYFRVEARELLDSLRQGALELEKPGAPPELIARLRREAHTLKGAARVVKAGALADLAHRVEDALAPWRDSAAPPGRNPVDVLLALLDEAKTQLAALDAGPARAAAPTVRLDVGEVDALLQGLSETAAHLALLRRATTALHRGRPDAPAPGDDGARQERLRRAAGQALERTERELRQTRERAERLRLLPVSSLFEFLERAVRDAAHTLGKRVRFETAGGPLRLDGPVVAALQDALLHIVRNAVAHGIEDAAGRAAAGKPREGCVRLEVERRGGRVVFLCRDDGRGIDVAAVRRAAAAKGLLPPTADLDIEGAARLLLGGGLSTSARVSAVSGRGVGLDVARETAERLKGEVLLQSVPGRGTTVEFHVPYSLSTFPALAVEAGGVPLLLPLEAVRRAVRVNEGDVARSPTGDTLLFEGETVPYVSLDNLLNRPAGHAPGRRTAVVVRGAAGPAAVGVDRIRGVRESVTQTLPDLAPAAPFVDGAGWDAEGNPCLVLDPDALVRAARERRGDAPAPARPRPPAVLVVDDSLTTRLLERGILESAGYEVETADSGEDGLAKARQKRPGLILVDVEMPGMDGFEFLERARADAALRDVPSILVTSRSSPEDRRRGEAAGARDYLVKGEFDQVRLLARIRELAG